MSFGDELRRAREAVGLTQEKLAFKAGLNPAYVNRLEVHKKSPSLEVFLRLCKALGVPPETLIAPIGRYFERHGRILPKASFAPRKRKSLSIKEKR